MKEKIYSTAPLPFQGQKRNFVTQFRNILVELKERQDVHFIVDLFGGSGLLSRTARDIFTNAEVVYNDYDNYHKRLLNIEKTNKLLADLRDILGDYPREIKIDQPYKNKIIERIKKEEQFGYIDYVTLSSSLLFSSQYSFSVEDICNKHLYNRIRSIDYNFDPKHYLYGLTVVRCDYRSLFNEYKDKGNVLFIIDPPYLSTDTTTYQSDKIWKLKNYLDVLHTLKTDNYFYFTSSKSQLVELCEWFEKNNGLMNPFHGTILRNYQVKGKVINYTDIMLYKYKEM